MSAGRRSDGAMGWCTEAGGGKRTLAVIPEQEVGRHGCRLHKLVTLGQQRRCQPGSLPLPAHHHCRCCRSVLLHPGRPAGVQSIGRQAVGSRYTARRAGTPACTAGGRTPKGGASADAQPWKRAYAHGPHAGLPCPPLALRRLHSKVHAGGEPSSVPSQPPGQPDSPLTGCCLACGTAGSPLLASPGYPAP